jgi:hypothetical protein
MHVINFYNKFEGSSALLGTTPVNWPKIKI